MFKEMKKRRLLARLGGPNPGASEAVEALAKLGDASIIPILLSKLTSKDLGNEVWLSIKLLGKLGDRTTPRAILNSLRPMARLYPPLVEAFDRLRASEDEWIELLGAIANDRTYRFGGDFDETYRIEAIKRLGQFGSKAAPILEALAGNRIRPGTGDSSSQVRSAARDAIAAIAGIPARQSRVPPRGTYSDEEIQFIIDSLTAWSIARHDNRYSPRLYDLSQLFHPRLTVPDVRKQLGSAGIAKAIATVATSQWIAQTASDQEASIARTFVYEPYLQGEAEALVREREAR